MAATSPAGPSGELRPDASTRSHLRVEARYVIGVDYGTTYTGVSWILTGNDRAARSIRTVQRWPGGEQSLDISEKVPSVYTYSSTTNKTWGYGVGESPYVIRLTKLKLRPPTKKIALEDLKRNLQEILRFDAYREQNSERQRGTRRRRQRPHQLDLPRHVITTPQEVLRDYMIKVAEVVLQDIKQDKGRRNLENYPFDLVITHPAGRWPQDAINSTVKAVTTAFSKVFTSVRANPIRHVLLATEPEACAQMTMWNEKEDRTDESLPPLSIDDCFVVVDAGGGTIDAVTCRVRSMNPFRIDFLTGPTRCDFGSTCVDAYFLEVFLPSKVGPQFLFEMNGGETYGHGTHSIRPPHVHKLLEKFITIKHAFAGGEESADNFLDLDFGRDIEDSEEHGIKDNQLRITSADMEEMFADSIDGINTLIDCQVNHRNVRRHGVPKALFLSGGFAGSPYLVSQVERMCQRWGGKVIPARDNLKAVSKGAVLLGLGAGCDKPSPSVLAPRHVGVVLSKPYNENLDGGSLSYLDDLVNEQRVKNHIHWTFSKGDLVCSSRQASLVREVTVLHKVTPGGIRASEIRLVTSDVEHSSMRPTTLDGSSEETVAPAVVTAVRFDLSKALRYFQLPDFKYDSWSAGQVNFAYVRMRLVVELGANLQCTYRLITSSTQDCFQQSRVTGDAVLEEGLIFDGSSGAQ